MGAHARPAPHCCPLAASTSRQSSVHRHPYGGSTCSSAPGPALLPALLASSLPRMEQSRPPTALCSPPGWLSLCGLGPQGHQHRRLQGGLLGGGGGDRRAAKVRTTLTLKTGPSFFLGTRQGQNLLWAAGREAWWVGSPQGLSSPRWCHWGSRSCGRCGRRSAPWPPPPPGVGAASGTLSWSRWRRHMAPATPHHPDPAPATSLHAQLPAQHNTKNSPATSGGGGPRGCLAQALKAAEASLDSPPGHPHSEEVRKAWDMWRGPPGQGTGGWGGRLLLIQPAPGRAWGLWHSLWRPPTCPHDPHCHRRPRWRGRWHG